MIRAIALVALAACNPIANPNYPPPEPLPADFTTCEVAEDCKVVELGCCDSCNGGTAVAVRVDHEAEAMDTYAQACDGIDLVCTEMACAPLYTECIENTCTLQVDTVDWAAVGQGVARPLGRWRRMNGVGESQPA